MPRKPAKDFTGEVYGRLKVIGLNRVAKNYNRLWNCICDCGNKTEVWGRNLTHGKTKSCGCLHKLKEGESSFNALLYTYKKSAKKRGIGFSLSKEYVRTITKENCHYCGIEPYNYINSKGCRYNGSYIHNGIDRKDSDIGYFEYNCVPCCKNCNYAKRDLPYNQFINLIRKIYNNTKDL